MVPVPLCGAPLGGGGGGLDSISLFYWGKGIDPVHTTFRVDTDGNAFSLH
jgi:hypothetical protein